MARKPGIGCILALAFCAAAPAGRSQTLQADLSFPYAVHQWNSTGVSADLGASFAGQNFLGAEVTSFSPSFNSSYPAYGAVRVDERIETLEAAYRYSLPLTFLGGSHGRAPVDLYAGGAAGFGRVRQTLTSPPVPGRVLSQQPSAQETEVCAELVAGLQFNFGPHFGIRAGFRYIDSINNVRLFGVDANTDTKAVEAGVCVRF